ncbi:MAG: DNA topoisomerase VI subunit B [Candidatus Altiarchaeota archaeon]|nr:DNA topoisomerase VI subunit B [Candidatus Altiarchaeota archaeon]
MTAGNEREADDLFKEFRETSITEFFRKNRAHLGYSGKLRSLTTIVHEIVTNALDACEEAGILPEIQIGIDSLGVEHYRVSGSDNGPGIPIKHVPDVFGKMLAGTKFHRNVQLRGQQGIGVAGVTLFSQITTGKPIKVKTSTGNGKVHEIELMIDITKNKADILKHEEYSEYWRGTGIGIEVKGVKFNLGERGPFEYLRRTAIANPHTRITFIDPEGRKTIFDRSSEKIPKPPVPVRAHPKGLEVDEIINMAKATKARKANSFLVTSLSRMSNAKVKEIQEYVSFDLDKNPRKLTWSECEEIINAIEKTKFLAPSMEGLEAIGEEHVRNAVLNILDPEFEAVLTRPPKVHSGGIPFQVEVAIAVGGQAGRNVGEGTRYELMRFANKAPLLFDAGGCAITKAVSSVDWKRYGIKDFENSPVTVFVNVLSTHIPYISAGKQSIAEDRKIMKEVRFALMEVGRRFQLYHSRKRRALEKEAKKQILLRYGSELASALAQLSNKNEEKIRKALQKLVDERITGMDLEEEEANESEMETMLEGESEDDSEIPEADFTTEEE